MDETEYDVSLSNKIYKELEIEKLVEMIEGSVVHRRHEIGYSSRIDDVISVFMSSFDFEYLFSFFSSLKSHFSIWSLLYLAVLISSVIFMGFGIINLILSLFARINPLIYQEERLVTDSVVFFGTIAGNKTFDAFSAKFDNCDKAKYLRDIQSQIYINSSIATAKFSYYNKGIKCSFTGFVIVAFILLVIRFII